MKADALDDTDAIVNGVTFRFDIERHTYTALDTGEVLPHITGLLTVAGWIDDHWYTEEGSDRGSAVHQLTASYDLGALDVATCVSPFRTYLLAHVKAMDILRPTWRDVEVPRVHPQLRFGGRPDRIGLAYDLRTVLEVKTGDAERSHGIQLALQAILVAGACGGLPAEHYERLALYLKPSGRFNIDRHHDRRDFDEARRILKTYC